jgi:hypothetical protein
MNFFAARPLPPQAVGVGFNLRKSLSSVAKFFGFQFASSRSNFAGAQPLSAAQTYGTDAAIKMQGE